MGEEGESRLADFIEDKGAVSPHCVGAAKKAGHACLKDFQIIKREASTKQKSLSELHDKDLL